MAKKKRADTDLSLSAEEIAEWRQRIQTAIQDAWHKQLPTPETICEEFSIRNPKLFEEVKAAHPTAAKLVKRVSDMLAKESDEVQIVALAMLHLHPMNNIGHDQRLHWGLEVMELLVHRHRTAKKLIRRREDNPKLNAQIRADRAAGMSWANLATKYGKKTSAVRAIVRRAKTPKK